MIEAFSRKAYENAKDACRKPLSPKVSGPIGGVPPSSSVWSALHGRGMPWPPRTPTALNQHESSVMAQNVFDTQLLTSVSGFVEEHFAKFTFAQHFTDLLKCEIRQ